MFKDLKPLLGARIIPGHPLAKGLIACWIMNEGGGNKIYDLSGSGNSGIITGPSWNAGNLQFTTATTDWVNVGSIPFADDTPWTFCAKIKRDNTANVDGIFGEEWVANQYSRLYATSLGFQFWSCVNTGGYWQTAALVTTDWMHIAVVCDGTELTLYANAISYGGITETPADTSINIKKLARLGHASSYYFSGLFEFVYVFNYALSASEVGQLYINPYVMFEESPFWLFQNVAAGGLSIPIAQYYYNQART